MRSVLLLVAALFVVVVPSSQNFTVTVGPLPVHNMTIPPIGLNHTHLPSSSNVTVHPTTHNATGPSVPQTFPPPTHFTIGPPVVNFTKPLINFTVVPTNAVTRH
ncbi:hypothetical protein M3Y94_01291700 [Aphelenchoides besseyi]|nr:hypothetical protein M3Y94_01291700 [Aphelenchoides besseyi]KAI6222835.1 hypothetical protein M3Y95_00935800 [Aphelenchoides besseyi]